MEIVFLNKPLTLKNTNDDNDMYNVWEVIENLSFFASFLGKIQLSLIYM